MRSFFPTFSLALLTTAFAACSHTPTNPAPADRSIHPANSTTYTLQANGTPLLNITGPTDLRPQFANGSLDLDGPQYEVEFWLVPHAKTLDDATDRIPALIATQFKDFKPDHTADLTIAGNPAKRLHGTGREADDGDPGEADIIVFKRGSHIFIACNHGEGLTPVGQHALLTMVQTSQTP